jgi:hypothetical protein
MLSLQGDFMPPVGDATDRPLLISTQVMGSGSTFSIKPWSLLRNNAAFKRVLGSCVGFTGVLHLRVCTVATPYVYGAINLYLDPATSYGGLGGTYDVQQISWDSEYSAHLDVALNQPAELVIPHFDEVPYMLATADTQTDRIVIKYVETSDIVDAQTAAAATVEVHTFAWVSGMQRIGISPQSSEYQPDRVISSSLSILADSARTVGRIPILSPFATAISVAADMGSKIAAILGFSRPTDVRDPSMMLMRNTRLAASVGLDDSEPLGLDPKQQRDLRHGHITGHGMDQLSHAYFVSRQGHLLATAWHTDYPAGAQLSVLPVNPLTVSTIGNAYKLTPLAVLSMPYAKWRGTLQYTFVVHCSRFHRGRLRVFWSATKTGYTDNPSNTAFITYLDILPGAMVTVSAPFVANDYFLNTYLNDQASAVVDTTSINGYIILEVDQVLVAPSAATVIVHVFVKACSDFELAKPSMTNLPNLTLDDYSAVAVPTTWADITAGSTKDTYIPAVKGVMTPVVSQSGCAPAEVVVSQASWLFGESVSSCRDLMKRYSPSDYRERATTVANSYRVQRVVRMPQAAAQTNSAVFNPVSWYSLSFGFTSGGVRHKLFLPDLAFVGNIEGVAEKRSVLISRVPGLDYMRDGLVVMSALSTTTMYFPYATLTRMLARTFLMGGVVYPSDANIFGAICPDMGGRIITSNRVMTSAENDTCIDFVYPIPDDTTDHSVTLSAIGEDFNVHVYFGVPRVFLNVRPFAQPPA